MSEMQSGSGTNSKAILVVVVVLVVVVAAIALLLARNSGEGDASNGASTQPTAVATAVPSGPKPTMDPKLRSQGIPDVKFDKKNGEFTLSGIRFLMIHYDDHWGGMDQHFNMKIDPDLSKIDENLWDIQAKWGVFNGTFNCHQTLKRIDDTHYVYDAEYTSDKPIATNGLMLEMHLPATWYGGYQMVFDSEPIPLPVNPPPKGTETLVEVRTVKSLQVATTDGTLVIDGPLEVGVQDNRNFGQGTFTLRLMFSPGKGPIKEASLKFKMRHVME
jgi:hypothetical protein